MSTKAIRHLIAVAKNYGASATAEEALREVEAIEKAARFITYVDTSGALTPELARDAAETSDTLERIAEESDK